MVDTNLFTMSLTSPTASPELLPHQVMGFKAVAWALGLDPVADLEALY